MINHFHIVRVTCYLVILTSSFAFGQTGDRATVFESAFSSPIRNQENGDCMRYSAACVIESVVRRHVSVAYWVARAFVEETKRNRRPDYVARGDSLSRILGEFRILFQEELKLPEPFKQWAIQILGPKYVELSDEMILDHVVDHFRRNYDVDQIQPLIQLTANLQKIADKTARICDEMVRSLRYKVVNPEVIEEIKASLRRGIPVQTIARGDFAKWIDSSGLVMAEHPPFSARDGLHAMAAVRLLEAPSGAIFTIQNSHGETALDGGVFRIPEADFRDFVNSVEIYTGKSDYSAECGRSLTGVVFAPSGSK